MRPLATSNSYQTRVSEQSFVSRLMQVMEGGWQMEEKEVDENSDSSKKGLIEILHTVRKPTWSKYLEILLMSTSPQGTTMNEISLKLGERPQTIHPLLKRMLERKALRREKDGKEYHYYLAADISKEEIEAQIEAINNGGSLDRATQLDLSDDEDLEQSRPNENKSETKQMTNIQEALSKNDRAPSGQDLGSREDRLSKLPGLPEFDPAWSEERKNKWFAIYEKLIELEAKKNAN